MPLGPLAPGSIACPERIGMNEMTWMLQTLIFGLVQIAWQIVSESVRLWVLLLALMTEWVEMLGVRTLIVIVQWFSNWIRPGCCVQMLARSTAS